MKVKKLLYLICMLSLLAVVVACGSDGEYREGGINPPARFTRRGSASPRSRTETDRGVSRHSRRHRDGTSRARGAGVGGVYHRRTPRNYATGQRVAAGKTAPHPVASMPYDPAMYPNHPEVTPSIVHGDAALHVPELSQRQASNELGTAVRDAQSTPRTRTHGGSSPGAATRDATRSAPGTTTNNAATSPASTAPNPSPPNPSPPNTHKSTAGGVNNNASPEGHIQHTAPPAAAKRSLASHQTKFDASDDNRETNIAQASKSINGTVVKPGESFSYNQTVGPTIERRGYEESIIYVDGEKKKGFGGGVCQVSTTLAIAADEAGMTITERHDHSRPVSYAKEGEEAATSYGGIDFKFKNEKDHAIIIHSAVDNGTITVTVSEA